MLITLDTQSITSQFDISKSQIDDLIDSVVKSITATYAELLERQAKENLHSTRKVYINSIKIFDEGRFKGAILLDYSGSKLVRMLEEGAQPFDIKAGFEKSSKRHLKKDGSGWYLTVPWREANPNAVGESDVFNGGVLPTEVYNIVKEKSADITTATGFKSKPTILSELPSKYQTPKTRKEVKNEVTNQKFEEYKNKTSIFAGISKIQDKVTGQNTYMSFRRVSDKSDPNSWIHTGITAFHLMDKAMLDLETQLPQSLNRATNQALANLGFS